MSTETDCGYSHLVVSTDLAARVSPGSAQAFDFGAPLGIDPATASASTVQKPVELSLEL